MKVIGDSNVWINWVIVEPKDGHDFKANDCYAHLICLRCKIRVYITATYGKQKPIYDIGHGNRSGYTCEEYRLRSLIK